MEDKLKILMTADTVGGVWTYVVSLCEALQDYNVEVHLATMGSKISSGQVAQVGELKKVFLYTSEYKLEWMEDSLSDVEQARDWLQKIYQEVQPNIIHFNNYGQVDASWNCPIVTVFHSCVGTWWKAVKHEIIPDSWNLYSTIVQKALSMSDVVVAPSHAILQQAVETYTISATTKVIYNSSSSKIYSNQKKERFILTAGRIWDEAKNIKILLAVAKDIPWPIYVAGSNNLNNDTSEAVENIKYLGQLTPNELQDLMLRASIFVMPSRYEPFGLAVLEAARARCALALADIKTFNEIWSDSAEYFQPEDEQQIVAILRKLIKDEEIRSISSKNSFQRAAKYSIEVMGEKYLKLYQDLLFTSKLNKIKNTEIA